MIKKTILPSFYYISIYILLLPPLNLDLDFSIDLAVFQFLRRSHRLDLAVFQFRPRSRRLDLDLDLAVSSLSTRIDNIQIFLEERNKKETKEENNNPPTSNSANERDTEIENTQRLCENTPETQKTETMEENNYDKYNNTPAPNSANERDTEIENTQRLCEDTPETQKTEVITQPEMTPTQKFEIPTFNLLTPEYTPTQIIDNGTTTQEDNDTKADSPSLKRKDNKEEDDSKAKKAKINPSNEDNAKKLSIKYMLSLCRKQRILNLPVDKNWFSILETPGKSITETHIDAALLLLKSRKSKMPNLFFNRKTVVLGQSFLQKIDDGYLEFLEDPSTLDIKDELVENEILNSTDYIYTLARISKKLWIMALIDMDKKSITAFNVSEKCLDDQLIMDHFRAYSKVLPYIRKTYLRPEEQCDIKNPFKIRIEKKSLPQVCQTDSGIVSLKILECMAMRISYSLKLKVANISELRKKLASDIFAEILTFI
ncbi:unnamed protein product [Cochlearia groenlandica]